MIYKGYTARIEYSTEDGCLIGEIAGIRDIVGFHGDSVAELRAAFEKQLKITSKCVKNQGDHRRNPILVS